MKTEIIPIVNEDDEIIGEIPRKDITKNHIVRASVLDVRNSKGHILLAQRGFSKKYAPGKWSVAVAGTVEVGETYEENIYKEAEEEIGLTGYVFTESRKLFHNNSLNVFCQYYSVVADKSIDEFVVEEGEVANLRWFSMDELHNLLEKSPGIFVTAFLDMVKEGLL